MGRDNYCPISYVIFGSVFLVFNLIVEKAYMRISPWCSKWRNHQLNYLRGFICFTLISIYQLLKYARSTHRFLVQLCINMPGIQFPYLRRTRRIKEENHQNLTFDRNKRLSGIPNSFKIMKVISHQSVLESWRMYLMFQIELFGEWWINMDMDIGRVERRVLWLSRTEKNECNSAEEF